MASERGANTTLERISDESRSVAESAKMHMRILEAQIRFLSEAGVISTEIKEMMSSLVAAIQRASPEVSQPLQKKPPAPTTPVLQTPLTVSVVAKHVGTSYRHLLAQPGDNVIVHAWTNNQKTAIAYNASNNMAGRIPADRLSKEKLQPVIDSEIYGDYIRICKWDDYYRDSGIGFNLATGEIGRFSVLGANLKNINPSD